MRIPGRGCRRNVAVPLFDEIRVGNSVVKLYTITNRGKPFIKLSYHWAGERKQRMLRRASKADEKEAKSRARTIATAMHSGRVDQINHLGDDQRELGAARDALSTVGISVDSACREYAQAREILDGRGTVLNAAEYFIRSMPAAIKRIETSDAVEEYIRALEHDKFSTRHIQDVRSRLRRFAADFRVPLSEITTAEMNRWLRTQDIAPRTRNNYRGRIIAFFHWAQGEGYLRKDVKTEADALTKVKAPTTIHIFTPEQAADLLDGAETLAGSKKIGERVKGVSCIHYLVLGMFPGVRPQEIARMSGANIRFPHNDIEVLPEQAKGEKHRPGRRRLIPIQPNVRAWLETYPPPDGRLCMAKTPKFVRELARKVGVPWNHDIMRHSAISYGVAATGNVDLIALWSGNSRDVIYESYLNQVTPAEAMLYHSIMPRLAPKNIVALPKPATA